MRYARVFQGEVLSVVEYPEPIDPSMLSTSELKVRLVPVEVTTPSYDPATEALTPPTLELVGGVVQEVWSKRDKTVDELRFSVRKLLVIDRLYAVLGATLWDLLDMRSGADKYRWDNAVEVYSDDQAVIGFLLALQSTFAPGAPNENAAAHAALSPSVILAAEA